MTEPVKKKRAVDAWRRFWGTINNPTPECTKTLKSYLETDAYKQHKISAIVLQTERGENTGTLHYQLYAEITKGKKLSSAQIHEIPGFARMALKVPPRSTRQAVEYCRKVKTRVAGLHGSNGTFRSYKDQPENKEIFDRIVAQDITMKEISLISPALFLRSHGGLQKMIGLHQKHRDFIPTIKIYVGKTGCGKTIKALAENAGAYPFSWPNKSTMWMDNYHGGNPSGTGHDTIIFDELTSGRIPMTVLMDIMSQKPYPVQYKGGYTTLNSHTMIFTTNEEPMDLYPGQTAKQFAMLRRRIIQFAEIWDFELPEGPHWETGYTGVRPPLSQYLSEIKCTKRTTPKRRSVGPDLQNSYGPRANGITGHKRSRDEYEAQPPAKTLPYGTYYD